MEITYKKCGDYLLPNLVLSEKETKQLNKYGLLRLEFLKNHKKVLYQDLLMKDKLNEHLFSVGLEAEVKVNHLIKKLIEFDGTINEELKEKNQLLWIQRMNNCKYMAEEIILKEYIYVWYNRERREPEVFTFL